MLAGLEPGLRLGTLVTPVTFRAAGILAKTVATLDVLSGGRAFCGIGAGWWAREHAGFGLRGRTAAAAFAQRHHAGTADEHVGRYRLLADRGVQTVFVSLPDLTGPEDVLRLAPVAAAFG
jgi:hypothetical protein